MPANHLIIGSPAKAIRTLSEQELAWKNKVPVNTVRWWNAVSRRCTVEPLREVEAGRKRLAFDENLRPKAAT